MGGPSATLISALSSMGPPPEPDLTALVPGCGRAYDALALARHGYAKVVAVDLSQTACDAALEELRSSGDPASRGEATRFRGRHRTRTACRDVSPC